MNKTPLLEVRNLTIEFKVQDGQLKQSMVYLLKSMRVKSWVLSVSLDPAKVKRC